MKPPRLLHNMAALGFLQVTNYALTLITLPYLTRVLGVASWGRVVFVQMVINYLIWITNWGFYLSATRKIAANRSNTAVVSEIYMATWIAQWLLTGAVIVLLVVLVAFFPYFSADRTLYVCGIGAIIGNALLPFWFFNGLERIREVAVIQILAKIPTVPLLFIFVRKAGDAYLVIGFNALCSAIVGIFTVAWIRKEFLNYWSNPGTKKIYSELKEGFGLFASTIWTNLYVTLVPALLGVLAGPVALGYYNLADRARGASTTILHPITHALFPRMSNLYENNHAEAVRLLRKSGSIIVMISALASLVLWLFSGPIVALLGGTQFAHAATVLKWLAPLPLLSTLTSFFVNQVIIPAQKYRTYYIIVAATGCLSLLLVVPLILWNKATGAALCTLLTESFSAMALLAYLLRHGFFIRSRAEFEYALADSTHDQH